MIPIDFGQLVAVVGPTGAIVLAMYFNRKPDPEKSGSNPLTGISDRLERLEHMLTEILTILRERK